MKLECYGYSDDTAVIHQMMNEESFSNSEDGYNFSLPSLHRPAFAEVKDKDGNGVIISFCYVGTWAIGIAPLDENINIPEWARNPKMRLYEDCDYSVCMELDEVPDDVKIKWRAFNFQRCCWMEEEEED